MMGAAAVSVTGRTAARMRSTQARSIVRAHARAQVASACRACGELVDGRRLTRRFCSGACRQAAWRSKRPLSRPVAHQRHIREREAARNPRPPMATFEGCTVVEVPFAEAKAIVTRYEWLGSMPSAPRACYGVRTSSGELAGVAVFAAGPAPESGDLCGPEHRDRAVRLARGACVHWAHPHAASFLTARACVLAHAEFGWTVFYAYGRSIRFDTMPSSPCWQAARRKTSLSSPSCHPLDQSQARAEQNTTWPKGRNAQSLSQKEACR